MTHTNFISSLLLLGYKYNDQKTVLRYEHKIAQSKVFICKNSIAFKDYIVPLSHDFRYLYIIILETLPEF